MYKKLRYRSQFWTDFHEIHMVNAGLLIGEPYCFWKQCAPKISFSDLSQMVWSFWGKNLEIVLGTSFQTSSPFKKVIFIFVIRRHIPSKMVMPSENNLLLLFWKTLFFEKIVK